MTSGPDYIHRTLKVSASEYERKLSAALLVILSKKIHELDRIVAALDASDVRPPGGGQWTEENFSAEIERLGAYPNSVGAPLGSHPVGIVPLGSSTPERPKQAKHGEQADVS